MLTVGGVGDGESEHGGFAGSTLKERLSSFALVKVRTFCYTRRGVGHLVGRRRVSQLHRPSMAPYALGRRILSPDDRLCALLGRWYIGMPFLRLSNLRSREVLLL